MKRIKHFEDFVNEAKGLLPFFGAVLTGKIDLFPDANASAGTSSTEPTSAASAPSPSSGTYNPTGTYNPVPGNDDFALYMQHQQGPAGAKGLVQAMLGTGKLNPDTIKTKAGTKYANLVKNVPSDRPQAKKDIIAALDNGDQKTAAAIFMNMWKEKWFSKQKQAQKSINDPKHSAVKDAILKASNKHNVPFDFAITVAMIESGFNPNVGNNRYKGLFAMDPNSNYGGSVTPMGNRWSDPYVNAENGVKLLKDNIRNFRKSLGNDWASLNVGSWANYA